jgi:hypothetical protein
LLASALDHAGWPSVLGTVGGDDTVLVIARDPDGGEEVAQALLRLAERTSPAPRASLTPVDPVDLPSTPLTQRTATSTDQ